MRHLFILALLPLSPAALPAQEKGDDVAKPIKVVKLDRKDPVLYEKDVEPIFRKRCLACHSGTLKESRFDMGSYEALVKGGKRGAAVVPGKAEGSNLYRMSGHTQKPFMPPEDEAPLTPEELALIK